MTDEQLQEIIQAIAQCEEGDEFRLSDLFADWEGIDKRDRPNLGKAFRAQIIEGRHPSVVNVRKDDQNKQVYRKI